MSIFLYFKRQLPDPRGPLSRDLPAETINEANKKFLECLIKLRAVKQEEEVAIIMLLLKERQQLLGMPLRMETVLLLKDLARQWRKN